MVAVYLLQMLQLLLKLLQSLVLVLLPELIVCSMKLLLLLALSLFLLLRIIRHNILYDTRKLLLLQPLESISMYVLLSYRGELLLQALLFVLLHWLLQRDMEQQQRLPASDCPPAAEETAGVAAAVNAPTGSPCYSHSYLRIELLLVVTAAAR